MADKATVTTKVVDFSNVKDVSGFNPKRVTSGDYAARVTAVADAPSKKDNVHQWLFTIKLTKHSQYSYRYYCKLQENQLWKLRNLFLAAGLNVPKKRTKIDPSKVVGKIIGVTMEDDEYEGRPQSVVASVFPASELDDADVEPTSDDDDGDDVSDDDGDDAADEVDLSDGDDDEGDEDSDDDAEDEGEDRGDEFDDMDRTQLKKWLVDKDENFKAKKSQSDDDLREMARSYKGDTEDSDDDDELEELDIDEL